MPERRSAQYPYRWSNGTWHSRPERSGGTTTGTYTPAKPAPTTAPTLTPGTPPQPPQLPLDPGQEAVNVANQRNLGISEAQAAYETGQIENEYGLGADLSNPFSQAQLLNEDYRRSQNATLNSYAAQGQLYSGAYGRMQGENTRNYNIGYDRLQRDYAQARRGVQQGRLRSYADYGTTGDDAAYQALLRAFRGG